MKRIALMFIALALTLGAGAQLNVTRTSAIHSISSKRAGQVKLNYQENSGFYLVFKTSNQFDDPGMLQLGKDKESSIATLNDLINVADTLAFGAIMTIDTGIYSSVFDRNEKCSIMVEEMLGAAYLTLAFEYRAGMSNVTRKELQGFVKDIEKSKYD